MSIPFNRALHWSGVANKSQHNHLAVLPQVKALTQEEVLWIREGSKSPTYIGKTRGNFHRIDIHAESVQEVAIYSKVRNSFSSHQVRVLIRSCLSLRINLLPKRKTGTQKIVTHCCYFDRNLGICHRFGCLLPFP